MAQYLCRPYQCFPDFTMLSSLAIVFGLRVPPLRERALSLRFLIALVFGVGCAQCSIPLLRLGCAQCCIRCCVSWQGHGAWSSLALCGQPAGFLRALENLCPE